jgi:hypothetical protein
MRTICHLLIADYNPLATQLKEKVSALRNYQTPRTAREFYKTVRQTFEILNGPLQKPFFRQHKYFLLFKKTPEEALGLTQKSMGLETAQYDYKQIDDGNANESILVTASPAYAIPGLSKDILLGRTRPQELMPIFVHINKRQYPIKYSESMDFFDTIRFP